MPKKLAKVLPPPKEEPRVSITANIRESIAQDLKLFEEHLGGASRAYVLEESLKLAFAADESFGAWKKERTPAVLVPEKPIKLAV